MDILFIDSDATFIEKLAEEFRDIKNVECHVGDITKMATKNHMYVLSSNTRAKIRSRADYLFNYNMFPGLNNLFIDKLRAYGRDRLEIGSSLIVKHGDCYVMMSPSTETVSTEITKIGIYRSFISSLCMYTKFNSVAFHSDMLVFPLYYVRTDHITPAEYAHTIYTAYRDFRRMNLYIEGSYSDRPDIFLKS